VLELEKARAIETTQATHSVLEDAEQSQIMVASFRS